MSTPEELGGCNELSTGQDADVAGQESSTSVACQAYPEIASKRLQARVLPASCSQGKRITSMICYTVQIEHLFLYTLLVVNVNISTSIPKFKKGGYIVLPIKVDPTCSKFFAHSP